MAKGEILQARIERIAGGGAGIARREGKVCFVDFSAPGDLLSIRITEERRGWSKGELCEILEPSPLRAEPPCPLYGRCGGCSLQHLSYDAQLSAKAGLLRETFARIGGGAAGEFCVRPSPPLGCRNRVQFHCLPSNRRKLGFKARHGSEIIPLDCCPVADAAVNEALKSGELVPPPEKDRFTVYARGDLLLSEGGKRRGVLPLLGKEMTIDAGIFFQSNAAMLEALLEDLKTLAPEGGRAMADIYCGAGTFAFFLGRPFAEIDLVEENKSALALARENLQGEGRRFYALSGDAWAKGLTGKEAWSFMILDPPREGLSPGLRRYLAKKGQERLAYVSCDPAAAARDYGELAAAGYVLKKLYFYDFYPQTAHIESLGYYVRK
ncbi:MAG: TRAM domain-containing protein [Treponema sp.]|jgi:23S rRNA (uracil1939-C5)-methyltransferase|nr:TRAM domain-containing protein [Treponema sp.]